MKTFEQLKLGDELVAIYERNCKEKASASYTIQDISSDSDYIYILLDDWTKRPTRLIIKRGIKREAYFVSHPNHPNYILTPKENFETVQKIFNIGYSAGDDEAKRKIRFAMGIYN